MSKNTKKTTGEKKPATKTKSAAPKAAAVKKAPTRAGAAPKPAAPKPDAVKKKTPPKPGAKRSSKATVVSAQADIGFGNQLFIRGEGAGLSWERGVPMACRNSDLWEWSTDVANGPITFKVLINDQTWAHGDNDEVRPGEKKLVQPAF